MEIVFYVLAIFTFVMAVKSVKSIVDNKTLLITTSLFALMFVFSFTASSYHTFAGYNIYTYNSYIKDYGLCKYTVIVRYKYGSIHSEKFTSTYPQSTEECDVNKYILTDNFKRIVDEVAGTTYVKN